MKEILCKPLKCFIIISELWQMSVSLLTKCLLTILRNYRERDSIAGIFNKLHNVAVRELNDGAAINSRDTVTHI